MLILIWPFQTQLNCASQPKKGARVRARFSLQLRIQAMLWWTNNGPWRALVSFLIFNPAPADSAPERGVTMATQLHL